MDNSNRGEQMINNARELINQEGFGTLQNLGRKLDPPSSFSVWVGLQPPINESHRPVWNDEPEAKNEEILDKSWESVEVLATTLDNEETDRIVLTFPFEYDAFLDSVTLVIMWASDL